MLSFQDIFKQSFLNGYSYIGVKTAFIALAVASVFALYLFFAYRVFTRKTFYSKTFNITLAGVTLVTTAVVLTIQSSIVVSLGMVGALSIVRFRTAVKDPMDLLFLFWAISNGIICGAGVAHIAALLSIALTLAIIILDRLPVAKASNILVINSDNLDVEPVIMSILNEHVSHPIVKSRNITAKSLDLVIELRVKDGSRLVREIVNIDSVNNVSLLSHDGEVTF